MSSGCWIGRVIIAFTEISIAQETSGMNSGPDSHVQLRPLQTCMLGVSERTVLEELTVENRFC